MVVVQAHQRHHGSNVRYTAEHLGTGGPITASQPHLLLGTSPPLPVYTAANKGCYMSRSQGLSGGKKKRSLDERCLHQACSLEHSGRDQHTHNPVEMLSVSWVSVVRACSCSSQGLYAPSRRSYYVQ